MKRPTREQRGIAAIELALILGFGLLLVPAMLLLGRVLWQYSALQIAVHNANRTLTTLPRQEMLNYTQTGAAIVQVQQRLRDSVNDSGMPAVFTPQQLLVLCDIRLCGGPTPPSTVTMMLEVTIDEQVFGYRLETLGGARIFYLGVPSALRYGE